MPFVSTGAVKRVPLKRGDLLVTRCDEPTVKCGQTDPREIAKYIRRGVRVHAVANLHAKVYTSAMRCIVCSANVSNESENRLVEAGIELNGGRVVAEAREFVESLTGDVVDIEFAKALICHYRPPKRPRAAVRGPRKSRALHSDLWAISVENVDYTERDEAAAEAGERDARRRGASDRFDRIERLALPDRGRNPRLGERVLQLESTKRSKKVLPPARILSARKYRSMRDGKRVMLTLVSPKGSRSIALRSVVKRLGPSARSLRDLSQHRLRDQELIVGLSKLWPDRSARKNS